MILAIALTILTGAASKLLNKVGSHRLSIYAIVMAMNVVGALVSLIALGFDPPSFVIPTSYYVPIGVSLLLWSVASVLSFYGIRHTQVSIRESLTQSRLIFVPLIAVLFLGEHISVTAGLGTLLILGGILIAVYRRDLSFNHPDMRGLGAVLAASMVIALAATLDKYIIAGVNYLYYSLVIYAGQSVIMLLFLNKERVREVRAMFHSSVVLIVLGAATTGALFYIMQLWLFNNLALHIAYPIVQLSSAFALVLAIIFLREHDRILFKILGFCVAGAGAFVLRLAM